MTWSPVPYVSSIAPQRHSYPLSLHIQEAWCWSKEQEDNPFLPAPCFIQVTRNQFLIAFLSIEEMALAGKNLHEVKEYCRFV